MSNKSQHIEYLDLITRKLSDEISAEENRKLLEWLNESHDNQQLFDSYKATWDEMDRVKDKSSREIDIEWNRLESALDFDASENQTKERVLFKSIYRYAASILMIAVAAFAVYYYLDNQGTEQIISQSQIQEVELSEGSKITVNSNSTLTYPKEFKSDKREVALVGEAFFEVAEDPKRPFIINTGDIQVEVLGTTFNVKAYDNLGEVVVIVSSGKVAVYPKDNPNDRVVLVKGEKATFYKESIKIEKSLNENINFNAWKTKEIIFEDTPMPEVIRIINEIYKSNIKIVGDELNDCPVTTTFNNQSLESILNVLESTLDLTIEKKDEIIEISGEGC